MTMRCRAGPLLVIMTLAAVGIWPDPNPNPVGPGILAMLTFYPGVICLVTGIVQVRRGGGSVSR